MKVYGLLLLFFGLNLAFTQESKAEEELSLANILDLEIEVATKSKQTLRDAPSIVSVVTAKDIELTGARDLIDVLRLVPGYTFAQDVLSVNTFVSRGLYAGEGKILLLIDGVELNDVSYGTHSLSHHIPVELIERIEIIRGPGSALYGGFAELGVINIITKSGSLEGHQAILTYGKLKDSSGTRTMAYAFGRKIDGGEINFNARLSSSNKATGDYTDINGQTQAIDNSTVLGRFFNVGIDYRGLKARILHDEHSVESEVLWGSLTTEPFRKDFDTSAVLFEYRYEFDDQFSFTPYASLKQQKGWWQPDADVDVLLGNDWRRITERRVAGGMLRYRITDAMEWTIGGENTVDESRIMMHFGRTGRRTTFASNGKSSIEFIRKSYYTQLTMDMDDIANVTVGGRLEDSKEFDETFVPRLGVTKVMGDTHIKLLASQAYRLPSIENYDLNTELEPEITTTFEVELGHKITEKVALTGNFFDTTIKDIIVYNYDFTLDAEFYYNYDEIATRGLELELKFILGKLSGSLTETYQKIQKNTAELFQSSRESNSALGSPENKTTLNLNFSFLADWNVNTNLIYESAVDAYAYDKSAGEVRENQRDATMVANIFLNKKDFLLQGLDLGFGIRDVADENPSWYQAANNGAMPYPGSGREILVRLTASQQF